MMENNRKVHFENEVLHKLLKKKEKMFTKMKSMQAEIDKIAKDGEVLAEKIQRIKDESIPLMLPHKKNIELGEFEVVQAFEVDGDKIAVTIVNLLEEEKLRIKEFKQKEEENENTLSDSDTDASSL